MVRELLLALRAKARCQMDHSGVVMPIQELANLKVGKA